MTKDRSKGQVMLSVAIDEKLLEQIDAKRGALTRSAYVRVAITKLLGVNEDLARPPERVGLSRGGRPTHKPKEKTFATMEEMKTNGKKAG